MPERIPTVPSGGPPASPEMRTRYVLSLTADIRDRSSIARKRSAVVTEASHARNQIVWAARRAEAPDDDAMRGMRAAVSRLERLLIEIEALEALALELQVDEDMPDATVEDDGTISEGSMPKQARATLALWETSGAAVRAAPLFQRFHAEATKAGYSPAGAMSYVRQELEAWAASVPACPACLKLAADARRETHG